MGGTSRGVCVLAVHVSERLGQDWLGQCYGRRHGCAAGVRSHPSRSTSQPFGSVYLCVSLPCSPHLEHLRADLDGRRYLSNSKVAHSVRKVSTQHGTGAAAGTTRYRTKPPGLQNSWQQGGDPRKCFVRSNFAGTSSKLEHVMQHKG